MFRGYKRFFGRGRRQTFIDRLWQINALTGGRVIFRFPSDVGDDWYGINILEFFCKSILNTRYDLQGIAHPPPVSPPNLQHVHMMFEVQLNSSRMFNTAHRGTSERSFARDWQYQILGSRHQIPRQYLDPYGKNPTPNLPLIHVLIAAHFAIQDEFCTPSVEIDNMPNGTSLTDVYSGGLARITHLNWLDPLRTGLPSPFHRPNIFATPTVRELAHGWVNAGGVRLVNILNHQQTGFPILSNAEMNEFCMGPYLVDLARSYLTSMRVKAADRLQYIDLATHHAERRRDNTFIQGVLFDQQVLPHLWYGTWPGCITPNTQPWQPCRILMIPKIPSRYQASNDHVVVIAYVPAHLPLRHPSPGYSSPGLRRIQMFVCGPR